MERLEDGEVGARAKACPKFRAKERCPFMGAVVCVIFGHVKTFAWSRPGKGFGPWHQGFHGAGRPAGGDGGGRRL
jgi:hypothetical protein